MVLLDVERFANFMGRRADDDAVWFAVEMAEVLVLAQAGAPTTPPPGLTVIAFSVAARLIAAPIGVASESEGGLSFGYKPDAGTVDLTDREMKMINLVMGRRSGLGEIGLDTVGKGARRFDPNSETRREAYELNDYPGIGHWARGHQ